MGNRCFRNVPCFILLCVVLSPSAVLADISPKQLLNKLFQSYKTVGYYASYVNIRPSGMRFSDVYNGVINEGVYRRTILSGDSDVEIVSAPTTVSYYDANTEEIISYPKEFIQSELQLLSSNLERARNYYAIHVVGNAEQVAERETYRLSVMAKVPDRYSRIYWIDQDNFIILRVDVLDAGGQLIERIRCTSLLYKKQEEHKLKASKVKMQYKRLDVQDNINDRLIHFSWLPDGFGEIKAIKVINNGTIETHQLLSDGFTKVTVVSNPYRSVSNDIEANHERDAWQKFVTNIAEKRVVVSGDVPLSIVKKIAMNISQ